MSLNRIFIGVNMTVKELEQQCPIIMQTQHLFPTRKDAINAQAKFFKNRTFVFDILPQNQGYVLKLRYSYDKEPLTLREIAEQLNVSYARVQQIEQHAFINLRKGKYLQLLMQYTDETYSSSLKDSTVKNFATLIRKDILRTIDSDTLKIINDVSISDLDVIFGYKDKFRNDVITRLSNSGIITCQDFVNRVKQFNTISEFLEFSNITYPYFNTILDAICNMIEKGDIALLSEQDKEVYQQHLASLQKRAEHQVPHKERKSQLMKLQLENNEYKRRARIRDGVQNPEFLLIEDLKLSTRSYKRLKKAGYNTMQDLIDSKGRFITLPGLGDTSVNEILTKAGDIGIYLQPKDSYKYAY